MIKKHNKRPVHQRTAEGTTSNRTFLETTSQRNNEDRNAPNTADHRDSYGDAISYPEPARIYGQRDRNATDSGIIQEGVMNLGLGTSDGIGE